MRKFVSVALALMVAVAIVGAQDQGKGGAAKGKGKGGGFSLPPTIQMTLAGSTNGMYPAANANPGGSPAISWTQVPAGTQAFALLLHDPEPVINKGASTDVTHWVIFDIPGTATGLPAGVPAGELPDGTKNGANITGQPSYFGPAPPAGHGLHHYTFELWALDSKLGLAAGATRDAVIKAMDGHVLGKGYVVAPYENK
jgi:Raf kinase inhibitor-like YbhB/YbcL family protein